MHAASAPNNYDFPLWLWYVQEFLRGLVLIYPTYLIMMEQTGVSPLGLSVLLAIWAGTSFLFEVPSGVLGDLLPRRWLLIAAGVIHAAAFIVWWLWPTFWGFALGFTVWSFGSSLYSGTAEAYLFEVTRNARNTATLEFAKVYGRSQAAAGAGIALALGCGGYVASFGYDLPLYLSMLTPAMASLAVFLMPNVDRPDTLTDAQHHPVSQFVSVMKQGSGTLFHTQILRQIALTTATLLSLLWVFEEYVGVLFIEQGVDLTWVGIIYAGVWGMRTLGNLLAHRLSAMSLATTSALFGTICLLALLISPLGVSLMAVALWLVYAMEGLCSVVLSSRLQSLVDDEHRATITSVMSMLGELSGLIYYLLIGIIAGLLHWTGTFYVALTFAVGLSCLWCWRLSRSTRIATVI